MNRWTRIAIGALAGWAVIAALISAPTANTKRLLPDRGVAEIHAISAALESYRADNGHYPSSPATEQLSPEERPNPAEYIAASQYLYRVLSGDSDGNPDTSSPEDHEPYFAFRNQMLRRTAGGNCYVVDPWGTPYGYSTLKAKHPESSAGHNMHFDLWSTGGNSYANDRYRWLKNW